MEATGIILAGGKSSRMGTNKALLRIDGKSVIEHVVAELDSIVNNIIIVTNSFEDYAFLNLPMVEDEWKGMGPLAGIHAGLSATKTEQNLLVACDMPFISAQLGSVLLGQLAEYQVAVPKISDKIHPLFAAYRKEVKEEAKAALEQKQLRIRGMFRNIHVKIMDEKELNDYGIKLSESDLFNMNHPEEYEQAKKMSMKNGISKG
ncbi:putative molybdenum cofactor guanylyltransferase [Robertmurraya siralis]|uniref:Probable molybdenum cofactor guanylyltransferase n=1 Tax=Robertmurraya siralis TaxID=77777 RepID=A0A919WJD5_9BACI|nr:molybdenum cofactor guanylyltransferase [Robertmurraya siralis]GIN63133.1 putative molybdenum cofactor guanylyltransferase [Robertmurraya siralis]